MHCAANIDVNIHLRLLFSYLMIKIQKIFKFTNSNISDRKQNEANQISTHPAIITKKYIPLLQREQ